MIKVFELLLNNEFKRYYDDCINTISICANIGFPENSEELQVQIFDLLSRYSLESESAANSFYLRECMSCVCASAIINTEKLENIIEENWPDYYLQEHELILCDKKGISPVKHISRLIKEAKENNAKQGKNGTYYSMVREPLNVIFRIITRCKDRIPEDTIDEVKKIAEQTLELSTQTVSSKISATKLLSYILPNYFKKTILNMVKEIIDNQETFCHGQEMDFGSMDSNLLLKVFNSFLLSQCNSIYESDFVEKIFSLEENDSYEIICILDFISNYILAMKDYTLSEFLLDALLHFAVSKSSHKDKDVKLSASRLLTVLTKFDRSRDLALITLSRIISMGSPLAKIGILSYIKKIEIPNNCFDGIIEKAKKDDNFLVRYAVKEYSA